MEKISNLGIMSNAFRAMAGLDSVYGYDIAVNENINALLKYGKFDRITYFYQPFQYQEAVIRRKYRSLKKRGNMNVELKLVSEMEVFNNNNKGKIDILHNVDMEFLPQLYYRETNPAHNMFPVTYMIHGASYPYYLSDFFLKKLMAPFRPYDSLICTSNAVQKAVSNILETLQASLKSEYNQDFEYKGRLDILPLGIDTDYFKPMDRKQSRMRYGIPMEVFVLLWIGRFSAYDKADLLPVFMAFRRLLVNNVDKEIKLIIAGYDRKSAPLLEIMNNYSKSLGIHEQVLFLEGHKLADRPYLYSCADIFISPVDNIQETFGLTPIEAMACGVPQVVSDWDGYKDSVVDNVTGYKIPTYWMKCDKDLIDNPMLPSEPLIRSALHHLLMSQSVAMDLDIFVKCVQGLIDNPLLLNKLKDNSVKRARTIYEWKNLIPKYEDLWSELKEISQEYGKSVDIKKKLLLFTPHYCDFFSEYPTRFIETHECIRITIEGKELLDGKLPIPKHYDVEDVLNSTEIAVAILKILKERESVSCDTLIKELNIYHEDKIKRSIMFVIKQGYAQLKKDI